MPSDAIGASERGGDTRTEVKVGPPVVEARSSSGTTSTTRSNRRSAIRAISGSTHCGMNAIQPHDHERIHDDRLATQTRHKSTGPRPAPLACSVHHAGRRRSRHEAAAPRSRPPLLGVRSNPTVRTRSRPAAQTTETATASRMTAARARRSQRLASDPPDDRRPAP